MSASKSSHAHLHCSDIASGASAESSGFTFKILNVHCDQIIQVLQHELANLRRCVWIVPEFGMFNSIFDKFSDLWQFGRLPPSHRAAANLPPVTPRRTKLRTAHKTKRLPNLFILRSVR